MSDQKPLSLRACHIYGHFLYHSLTDSPALAIKPWGGTPTLDTLTYRDTYARLVAFRRPGERHVALPQES